MKRKTISLGYVRTRLSFAVMYDGMGYTIEKFYGGSTRKKLNDESYDSDEKARAALGEDIEWRTLNVQDQFIRNARVEIASVQLCLFAEGSS